MAILLTRRSRDVYAFEPNPERHDRFASVTEGYGNITPVACAASDRAQRLSLNLSTHDLTATASSLDRPTDGRRIEVDCITLDAWCAANAVVPNFIKIDAEGHDLAVIRGAADLIARHRPTMLVEASGTEAERRLFDELSANYRILRIPTVDDPFWQREFVDAVSFYYDNACNDPVNIGFIPLAP